MPLLRLHGSRVAVSGPHLQDQPQLVSALDVLLVVHPVELDHVGVVGEGLEDVVLCLDLFVDVLAGTETETV